MVDFKKVTKKLSIARDKIAKKQKISPEVEKILESMLEETCDETKDASKRGKFEAKTVSGRILTDDQHHRLRLVEKTGTGSTSIH